MNAELRMQNDEWGKTLRRIATFSIQHSTILN